MIWGCLGGRDAYDGVHGKTPPVCDFGEVWRRLLPCVPVFAGLGKEIPLRRGFAPPELRGYGAAETLVAAGVNGMPYGNAYAMAYAIKK